MNVQTVSNKRGEIEFRRKLIDQQLHDRRSMENEFDGSDMDRLLQERMNKTLSDMKSLKERGIPLSPFLEIGAERGQRSLVMQNDLSAEGFAADISFDMLKSANRFSTVFGKSKMPFRVCCDAYHLPFLSNSLPFVFCYETLHHFPSPSPIIREIRRVLAPGGTFFFEEEPYRQIFHFRVYEADSVFSASARNRGMLRRLLDYFFSKQPCNEQQFGILENHDISLREWKEALEGFEEKLVEIRGLKLRAPLFGRRNPLLYFFLFFFGGGIAGRCKKAGTPLPTPTNLYSLLACPDCRECGNEHPLNHQENMFFCTSCHSRYEIRDGVTILLPSTSRQRLYPSLLLNI